MRYVTLRVTPEEGYFHPVSRRFFEEPSLTPQAVHGMEALGDGTCVMFTEFTGDLERAREIYEASPEVHDFSVAGDGRAFGYSRVELNESTAAMIEQRRELELVVDTPIEFTPGGGHRVTLIGDAETITAGPPAPIDGVDVTVEEMGEFGPDRRRLVDRLTERQREVLAAAVGAGYYDHPRTGSLADVAAATDLAAGTVGEHLQKVEAAVLPELLN
jgi:hypothetical protein